MQGIEVKLNKFESQKDNEAGTTDEIMKQLDKYIEEQELYIRCDIESGLRNYYSTYNSYKDDRNKYMIRKKVELESRFRRYSLSVNDKIFSQNLKLDGQEVKEYFNIFEYIYKLLKYLFTSSKQMSHKIDEIISRLDMLEKENNKPTEKIYFKV